MVTAMKISNNEMDMSSGSLVKKILIYSVPLMLSGMLQLLYNAADLVVAGRFVGETALAAIGATGSLTALITNLFIGLSVGASVSTAQYYGAKDDKNVSEVVHTAILISAILGAIASVIGIFVTRPLLLLMKTPDDVIEHSVLYMRIIFSGMTASMVFNFGSAILRAVGDTKRPLIYLTISGTVNVLLNIVLVTQVNLGVAGVAIATIVSQLISAVLVIITLIRNKGSSRLSLRRLRIHKNKLYRILRIGIPAGIQGTVFSISNVLVQSSVNSFGKAVMAGNSAGANIDGFLYTACNAFYHAALAFTGQNYGAKKFDRIGKAIRLCILFATVTGLALGSLVILFGRELLSLYVSADGGTASAEVIHYGMIRLSILGLTYFLCGLMEIGAGALRGLGLSMMPMLVSIVGVCGARIAWIYTAFAMDRTLETLYVAYPVSWFSVAVVHYLCFLYIKKKLAARHEEMQKITPVRESGESVRSPALAESAAIGAGRQEYTDTGTAQP